MPDQDPKTTVMFCHERDHHKGGKYLDNFYPNAVCVRMCGDEEVLKVRITEDPTRDPKNPNGYWGWWDTDSRYNTQNRFTFVYPHQMLLNMCFTYGPEVEEKREKGVRLPVKIEVLSEVE
jgi:hypothetical protein